MSAHFLVGYVFGGSGRGRGTQADSLACDDGGRRFELNVTAANPRAFAPVGVFRATKLRAPWFTTDAWRTK
jgi:hypothetical protein